MKPLLQLKYRILQLSLKIHLSDALHTKLDWNPQNEQSWSETQYLTVDLTQKSMKFSG